MHANSVILPPGKVSRLRAKTAGELVADIVALLELPNGAVISLTEMTDDSPNWSLSVTGMGDNKVHAIIELIAQLVETHPIIDWSGEFERSENRRTIRFGSNGAVDEDEAHMLCPRTNYRNCLRE